MGRQRKEHEERERGGGKKWEKRRCGKTLGDGGRRKGSERGLRR